MKLHKELCLVKVLEQERYHLVTGYLLESERSLGLSFPALISKNNQSFICIEKEILKKVWGLIEKRPAKITEIQLYVNSLKDVGFKIISKDRIKPVHVLFNNELDIISKKDKPFNWKGGLYFYEISREEIISPFK
jgi:hypothetical protein